MNEEDAFKEFEEVTRPVIKWLCENRHPHTLVIISCDGADVVEGVLGFNTADYIPD